VLNFDSLQIKNLNASIVLNLLRSDSLNLEISKVNFREKSGFSVDNFSTELIGSTNGLKIDFIDLKLPASHISFDNIKFSYDSLADFKDFANKVDWNVPLKKSVIAFSDLKYIVPQIKRIKNSLKK
jgi:hypothetical protein